MDNSTQVGRPWRVGVLFSETGVTAAVERTQLQATLLAIDEINAAGGVLDLPLEPVRYDPESNPKQFRVLAERLLGVDRVRLVFGCYMSSSRKAVLPVIEALRALLFYPTLYEGSNIHGTASIPERRRTKTPCNWRKLFVAALRQPLSPGRLELHLPVRVQPGDDRSRRQNHGKIVNEIYVPLNAREAGLQQDDQEIKKTQARRDFLDRGWDRHRRVLPGLRRRRLRSGQQPIASLTTSEAEVAEMAAETAEGHITAAPFFETLGTAGRAPLHHRLQTAIRGGRADDRRQQRPPNFRCISPPRRSRAPAPPTRNALLPDCAIRVRRRRRGACGSTARTITPISGRGWPRLDARRNFQIVWDPGVSVQSRPLLRGQSLYDWSADAVRQQIRADAVEVVPPILRDLRGLRVSGDPPPDRRVSSWWTISAASAARWRRLADP